jgi:hypothetical protein
MRGLRVILILFYFLLYVHIDGKNISSTRQKNKYQKLKKNNPNTKVYTVSELWAVYDSLRHSGKLLPKKSKTMYIED